MPPLQWPGVSAILQVRGLVDAQGARQPPCTSRDDGPTQNTNDVIHVKVYNYLSYSIVLVLYIYVICYPSLILLCPSSIIEWVQDSRYHETLTCFSWERVNPGVATSSSENCSVILACVDMNHFKYNTDGLGGHYGLACSLGLGVARGVTKHRFHLLFLSMIVMCMGSPMSLQIPLHSLILK